MVKATLAILICLIINSISMRIPCEYTVADWNSSNTFTLSQREMLVQTKYNFQMIIDPIDGAVSKYIKENGVWQPSIVHLAAYFIKPNSKVLNLGSQTGLQAIVIGNLINPAGRLYIFQPYSVSYNIVKKNIFLNDLEDITQIYKVGASDAQAKAEMLIFKENTGGAEIYLSSMPQINPQRDIMKEEVEVDLVDQVLPEDVIIDFILMDVEKMEVEALMGMRKLMERSKDMIILLQWAYAVNSRRNQAKAMRLIKWMEQVKLKVYSYIENEGNKCAIGTFHQIQNIYQLLTIPVSDILIIPSHIDPSKFQQY